MGWMMEPQASPSSTQGEEGLTDELLVSAAGFSESLVSAIPPPSLTETAGVP